MDYLCPQINRLVSCYTCGGQALPPYRLCLEAHVACPPCVQYLSRCSCGYRFATGSNTTFDWLVSAMKLKCKYGNSADERANGGGSGGGSGGSGGGGGGGGSGGSGGGGGSSSSSEKRTGSDVNGGEDCVNRWFDVKELREHYRTGCTKNTYTCPLTGCGHVDRVDTIVDHYEAAHGPFVALTPNHQRPYEVTFVIPASAGDVVRKIFNGYFLFIVTPSHRRKIRAPPQLSIQNINPSDPLRYTYDAMVMSMYIMYDITVTVTMVET